MKPTSLEPDTVAKLRRISAQVGDDLRRFPDFLLLGPQRTGSSWLCKHLARHPEIFLPREKETYYFSTLGQRDKPKYRYDTLSAYLGDAMRDTPFYGLRKRLRSGLRYAPRVFGDATASNATLDAEVIREICVINPELKGVIVLRPPDERARSHAKKAITAHTSRSPEEVAYEEYDRFLRARGQKEKADYRTMIGNWQAALKPGHLLVTEFRRVAEVPQDLLRTVLKFLDVDAEWARSRSELQAKVYSTGDKRLPDAVEARIQELYSDAVADYLATIEMIRPSQIDEGCYRV